MIELATVAGSEIRYLPRRQEIIPVEGGEDKTVVYDAAFLLIIRYQVWNLEDNGSHVLAHVSRSAVKEITDSFETMCDIAQRWLADAPIGSAVQLSPWEKNYLRDATAWTHARPGDAASAPVTGHVVGFLALYHAAEQRGRQTMPPQVVPYLAVQIPRADDLHHIVHVRLLSPGHPQSLVPPDTKPSSMMRAMGVQMQYMPPIGVPLGSAVRVGISKSGEYLMVDDEGLPVVDSTMTAHP